MVLSHCKGVRKELLKKQASLRDVELSATNRVRKKREKGESDVARRIPIYIRTTLPASRSCFQRSQRLDCSTVGCTPTWPTGGRT